jgi:hypothetical protein
MKKDHQTKTAADAVEFEVDSLLQAKRERQQRDRDDVRSGRRSAESMTFDRDEARKVFVLKRRSFDY